MQAMAAAGSSSKETQVLYSMAALAAGSERQPFKHECCSLRDVALIHVGTGGRRVRAADVVNPTAPVVGCHSAVAVL
jgi:hypothetical protein